MAENRSSTSKHGGPSGGVGAVIVMRDSADEIQDCIESLLAAPGVAAVRAVDNASSDGSADAAAAFRDERLAVIALDVNTGFAGGCNRGLAALPADIEFVAFLNPDVEVEAGCLSRCVELFESDPELGGVAPRLMRSDGITVDSVGQVLHRRTLEVVDLGYGQPLLPELLEPRQVLAACGALAVFRRSALLEVAGEDGPWAEHFFCFWEDLELGWRLTSRGWKVLTVPDAVAIHGRGSGAEPGAGPLRWRRPAELEACILSNRWMTLLRHLHGRDLLRLAPWLSVWDTAAVLAGVARRPALIRHLLRRWPLVYREWRLRERLDRRRFAELPC